MQIKPLQIRAWAKLGQDKAFFGIGIMEVAKKYPNLYVATADLNGYSGMDRFSRAYPEKVVNVGIQEQNMVSVATGMAMEGNLVYAGSYAAFSVLRAMEQVRHNLSVLKNNVKLVGYSAGYSKESLGRSHWATEDIALTRCLPNMVVVSPADSLEAVKACLAVAEFEGPAYIRLCGGADCPMVYEEDYEFQIGKGIVLREGSDTAIIATGRMVAETLKAAEELDEAGISTTVVNMHTIKPLDEDLVEKVVSKYKHIYVAEEHNVIGGLGSAVAEYMATNPCNAVLHRIGMQDCFYNLGSGRYIWRQAGLCSDQIADTIKKSLNGGK